MQSVTDSFKLSKKGLPVWSCNIPSSDGMLVAKQEYLPEDFLNELFQRPSLINEDALQPFLKRLAEKDGEEWKAEAIKSIKKASQKTLLAIKRTSDIFINSINISGSPEDEWKTAYFFWFFNRLMEKPEQREIDVYLATWLRERVWTLFSRLKEQKEQLELNQNKQQFTRSLKSFLDSVEKVLELFKKAGIDRYHRIEKAVVKLRKLDRIYDSDEINLDKFLNILIKELEKHLKKVIPDKKMPLYRMMAGLSKSGTTKHKVEAIKQWHHRHEQVKEKYIRKERTKRNTTVVELRPILKGG